jgi:adenylosuccinate synthase
LTPIDNESDFPPALNAYIKFIENAVQVPISIVSVGPNRKQTIIRKNK